MEAMSMVKKYAVINGLVSVALNLEEHKKWTGTRTVVLSEDYDVVRGILDRLVSCDNSTEIGKLITGKAAVEAAAEYVTLRKAEQGAKITPLIGRLLERAQSTKWHDDYELLLAAADEIQRLASPTSGDEKHD
jgi:hypothetical protein